MRILLMEKRTLKKLHSLAQKSPWKAYMLGIWLAMRDRLVWTIMSNEQRHEAIVKNENKLFFGGMGKSKFVEKYKHPGLRKGE